jgi:hypothetical protein
MNSLTRVFHSWYAFSKRSVIVAALESVAEAIAVFLPYLAVLFDVSLCTPFVSFRPQKTRIHEEVSTMTSVPPVKEYTYPAGTPVTAIANDVSRVEAVWKEVLKESIKKEAAQTNNWSMLWKVEAAHRLLRRRLEKAYSETKDVPAKEQEIIKGLRDITATELGLGRYTVELWAGRTLEISVGEDDRVQNVQFVAAPPPVPTAGPTASATVGITSGSLGALLGVGAASPPTIQWGGIPLTNSNDGKANKPVTLPAFWASGGSDARVGGAASADEIADTLVKLIRTRRLADEMFYSLLTAAKCDATMTLPDHRPAIEGFDSITSKLVEWLLWPMLSPAVFRVQPTVLLYGPPAAGKTVIARLAAFDMRQRLKTHNARLSGGAKDRPLITYYVDAMALRNEGGDVIGRLRNYFHCLHYQVSRGQTDDGPRSVRRMGLMVLDNVDALGISLEELRNQPRPTRKASQIRDVYVTTTGGGASAESTPTPPRAGGNGPALTTTTTITTTTAALDEQLRDLLNPSNVLTNWPSVRVMLFARYPWRLPAAVREYVKGYELFVDLPDGRVRRSTFELYVRMTLYQNVAERILERNNMWDAAPEPEYAGQNSPPDQDLYNEERTFGLAIQRPFLQRWQQYVGSSKKAAPENIIAALLRQGLGGYEADITAARLSAERYIKLMAPVLDMLTTATGMSLEGFCQLQTQHQLSSSEVDLFLVATHKKRDGLAGVTPFGYNREDMRQFFERLKATVNQRLLTKAFEDRKAFIWGSTRFASKGCMLSARESVGGSKEPLRNGVQNPDAIHADEKNSCQLILGPDLQRIDGAPGFGIPMWARYGSHRILRDDLAAALKAFQTSVTPKLDYPSFITYVLFHVPKLNRAPLEPGQISALCRTQPGPAATYLMQQQQRAPTAALVAPIQWQTWAQTSAVVAPLPPASGTQPQYILFAGGDTTTTKRRAAGAAGIRPKKKVGPKKKRSRTPPGHFSIDDLFVRA